MQAALKYCRRGRLRNAFYVITDRQEHMFCVIVTMIGKFPETKPKF